MSDLLQNLIMDTVSESQVISILPVNHLFPVAFRPRGLLCTAKWIFQGTIKVREPSLAFAQHVRRDTVLWRECLSTTSYAPQSLRPSLLCNISWYLYEADSYNHPIRTNLLFTCHLHGKDKKNPCLLKLSPPTEGYPITFTILFNLQFKAQCQVLHHCLKCYSAAVGPDYTTPVKAVPVPRHTSVCQPPPVAALKQCSQNALVLQKHCQRYNSY